jgi:hypothetical protein
VFRIDPAEDRLIDLGGVPILQGEEGEAGAPMGIGLYRRDTVQAWANGVDAAPPA